MVIFFPFSSSSKGLNPTWEEYCGRDTQYLQSMKKVLEHEFGSGEDGNGLELYFSVSERQPDGKVLVAVACKPLHLRCDPLFPSGTGEEWEASSLYSAF